MFPADPCQAPQVHSRYAAEACWLERVGVVVGLSSRWRNRHGDTCEADLEPGASEGMM